MNRHNDWKAKAKARSVNTDIAGSGSFNLQHRHMPYTYSRLRLSSNYVRSDYGPEEQAHTGRLIRRSLSAPLNFSTGHSQSLASPSRHYSFSVPGQYVHARPPAGLSLQSRTSIWSEFSHPIFVGNIPEIACSSGTGQLAVQRSGAGTTRDSSSVSSQIPKHSELRLVTQVNTRTVEHSSHEHVGGNKTAPAAGTSGTSACLKNNAIMDSSLKKTEEIPVLPVGMHPGSAVRQVLAGQVIKANNADLVNLGERTVLRGNNVAGTPEMKETSASGESDGAFKSSLRGKECLEENLVLTYQTAMELESCTSFRKVHGESKQTLRGTRLELQVISSNGLDVTHNYTYPVNRKKLQLLMESSNLQKPSSTQIDCTKDLITISHVGKALSEEDTGAWIKEISEWVTQALLQIEESIFRGHCCSAIKQCIETKFMDRSEYLCFQKECKMQIFASHTIMDQILLIARQTVKSSSQNCEMYLKIPVSHTTMKKMIHLGTPAHLEQLFQKKK